MLRRALLTGALAVAASPLCSLSTATAQPGGITVAPVLVTLTPTRTISSIRLRNNRAEPVSFEVEANRWRQDSGRDVLTPTSDILLAPRVFEAPARSQQIIRLGVQTISAAEHETAYRLVFRELPRPSPNGAIVGVRLEMSLPVFAAPNGVRGSLVASAVSQSGAPVLTLSNAGAAHVQLIALSVAGDIIPAPRYLLAGSSALVPLPRETRSVRIITVEPGPSQVERVVHVR